MSKTLTTAYPVRCAIPRRRVAIDSFPPTLAKQGLKESSDINFIIRQYKTTGYLEHVNNFQAVYGEAPAVDYREALELVRNADALFLQLPSSVRKAFNNDPGAFLDFTADPANLEKVREMAAAPASAPPPSAPTA